MSSALSVSDGLSLAEVKASRKEHGSNAITPKKRRSFLSLYADAFGDPIIKILCAALCVNILFSFRGEGWFETAGIALSVFLSSFVSTLSEYGSESAFIRLQKEAAKNKARVKREGVLFELSWDELVCGDAVFLSAGDMIPADGVLISGELTVDQSSVNGESAEKRKTPLSGSLGGTHSENALFRGTVVTGGDGVMRATAVGNKTVFGQMAASLSEQPRESPLKLRLSGLAATLSRIGYVFAALIGLSDLISRIVLKSGGNAQTMLAQISSFPVFCGHILHALTLSISIVIMAVPEGLPMMITVVLSGNMFKMLRDKVMVRKLAGIETAGSMNVLFTDKTGTLTRGKPEILGVVTAGFEGLAGIPAPAARIMYISGFLNTSARLARKTAVSGNATDRLMLDHARSLPPCPLPEREDFIPFSSENKYSAARAGGRVYIKGAPEKLLPFCKTCRSKSGSVIPFDRSRGIESRIKSEGAAGNRTLMICTAENMPDGARLPDMCFEALIIIGDDLRRDARAAVSSLKSAGVKVVMVTGDNRDTALSIAEKCGIADKKSAVLSGEELSALSDEEISAVLPSLAVVARALPGDKSRLVKIAQSNGLVCGMTGDGINDAPALKLSDVGFALGGGADVAKDAGDIIITDDNISSISRALLYGRTILRSIRRFIVYQLTMNMCAVGISLLGPFIGIDTPVTVAQILWTNLIMDTLAGLAFSGEPPLPEYMTAPPERFDTPLLTSGMKRQIAATALYSIALCAAFLKLPAVRLLFPGEREYYTGFFALFIFTGIAGAFTARCEKINVFSNLSKNPAFLLVMTAVFTVQIALIYFGGATFRAFGLTLYQLLFVLGLSLTLFLFDLLRKMLLLRLNRDKIQ